MEKYALPTEKAEYNLNPPTDEKGEIVPFPKTVISPEAFAICEFIEMLILKIDHTRRSFVR